VARRIYDEWQPTEVLDPALRDSLDLLAGHFHAKGDFEKVFIHRVPWNDLVGQPNTGHAAIADLLISRGAHAALSANFDAMIELWAEERKIAMQGALTGQEAVTFSSVGGCSPLLKFHGCLRRAREQTLWTTGQLVDPPIKSRVQSCSSWMDIHLPGKNLVVIGFWTDWGYLNDVLANAFTIANAHSVTVVDPSSAADLQARAPILWGKLTGLSNTFEHVQASGAEVLDELRTAYSRSWIRKFYSLGSPLAAASGTTMSAAATPDGLAGEDLYNLRRDVEGVPYTHAATLKMPASSAAQASLFHLMLLNAGATKEGAWLKHGSQSVRIVNGAGKGLASMEAQYKEPTTFPHSEIVVCAGAIDLGVPATLIASGSGASVMRPAPGGGSRWLTFDQARTELGL
jgi:hypothetical protein